jgi:DNA replication protein DnaC
MGSWTEEIAKLVPNLDKTLTPDEEERLARAAAKRAAIDADDAKNHPHRLKALFSKLSVKDVMEKTFDLYQPATEDQRMLKMRLMAWKPADNFGVMLYGPVGTGKTHLLKALLIKWADKNFPTRFLTVASVMDSIKASFDQEGRREGVVDELTHPHILVLDDLGAERSTEWAQEQFLTILEKRLRLGRVVFMTSNLGKEELGKRYDKRILDRLQEMCVFCAVEGDSQRRNIYAKNAKKFKEGA